MESIITIPPKITKELIESKISQETLMATYYGVPIHKGLFKSKFRSDNNPTVCYYKNSKGRLIVKDFGSDFCGDWLYVVQHKFSCDFVKALLIAANDFGIVKNSTLVANPIKVESSILEPIQSSIIQVEIRPFQQYELDWWLSYGITEKTLNKFKVFSCKNIWLNDKLFHLETSNQKIFGYYGGIKNNMQLWRLYFAGNRKFKFLSNWEKTKIQGASQIPKNGEYIVITKSLKDVMCLYEFGITAIAPCSENLFVTEAQYNYLKLHFKNIFLLYDLDIPGIKAAKRIKHLFPEVSVLLMPWGTAKDFSDYYKKYGKDKTLELINKAKEFLCLKDDQDHITEVGELELNKK